MQIDKIEALWNTLSDEQKKEYKEQARQTIVEAFIKISKMVDDGKLSSTNAQKLVNKWGAQSAAYQFYFSPRFKV